ncbi:MAG: hypothetical protein FWE53_03135 [Firmicutes bacterium]|nr:hypothetical protein [Bacillota bacterium]
MADETGFNKEFSKDVKIFHEALLKHKQWVYSDIHRKENDIQSNSRAIENIKDGVARGEMDNYYSGGTVNHFNRHTEEIEAKIADIKAEAKEHLHFDIQVAILRNKYPDMDSKEFLEGVDRAVEYFPKRGGGQISALPYLNRNPIKTPEQLEEVTRNYEAAEKMWALEGGAKPSSIGSYFSTELYSIAKAMQKHLDEFAKSAEPSSNVDVTGLYSALNELARCRRYSMEIEKTTAADFVKEHFGPKIDAVISQSYGAKPVQVWTRDNSSATNQAPLSEQIGVGTTAANPAPAGKKPILPTTGS